MNCDKLREAIKALDDAECGSRELDWAIACAIEVIRPHFHNDENCKSKFIAHYNSVDDDFTTSYNEALGSVPGGWQIRDMTLDGVGNEENEIWSVLIYNRIGIRVYHKNLILAIMIASLKASLKDLEWKTN